MRRREGAGWMTAIRLAAGAARGLVPPADATPSALVSVRGRPIIASMLEHLRALGLTEAVVVVGHRAKQVRAVVAQARHGLHVQYLEDPDHARGSALTLACARDALVAGPSLILDVDVVFPREALRRLVEAPAANALVSDLGLQESGDRVKIYTRANRVVAIGRKVKPERWDTEGVGVGFFKCGESAGRDLVVLLDRLIADGGGACEYEDALHLLAGARLLRAVDVTGLPWTKVELAEDLRRAERVVFPLIQGLDGSA